MSTRGTSLVPTALALCLMSPPVVSDDCDPGTHDTRCTTLDAEVLTIDFSGGTVFLRATAVDDSGDPIHYLFTASRDPEYELTKVVGPQLEPSATFEKLETGLWTVTVLVNDDPACPASADSICSEIVHVPHIDFGMTGRGDNDGDLRHNIVDAIYIFSFLFVGGSPLPCRAAADVNVDGRIDISDAISLLSHLFLGGQRPEDPFPYCGFSGRRTDFDLGCEQRSC